MIKKRRPLVTKPFKSIGNNCTILLKNKNRSSGYVCEQEVGGFEK